VDHSSLKKQHARAFRTANAEGKKHKALPITPFVLYSYPHTFLTRPGLSGCDDWTLACRRQSSEIELQGKLDDTWRSRLCDLPEIAVKPGVVRIKKLSVIEGIEELRAEFNTLALGQFEGPPDSQIEVVAPWAAESVPTRIPEAEHCIVAVECRGIEIELGIGDSCWQTVGGRGIEAMQRTWIEGVKRPDQVSPLQENVLST
jgi:hypothetical protein